jgi:hypothetical protein
VHFCYVGWRAKDIRVANEISGITSQSLYTPTKAPDMDAADASVGQFCAPGDFGGKERVKPEFEFMAAASSHFFAGIDFHLGFGGSGTR